MIAIVCDSSVGYRAEEIANRNVTVVPVGFQIGQKLYEERPLGENGDFLAAMEGQTCKTSQPAMSKFIDAFNRLNAAGYEVLCITLSSALSGTYSTACIAAKQAAGKVTVYDSETIGGGLYLLVDEAVNLVRGGLNTDEITAHLDTIRRTVHTVFSVDSLAPLKAGGRFFSPKAQANLNYRPVLRLAKNIRFFVNARGERARVEQLCSELPDSVRRIVVMRCGKNTDVSAVNGILQRRFSGIKLHQREVGPILSIHVGEGAIGIAYITKSNG